MDLSSGDPPIQLTWKTFLFFKTKPFGSSEEEPIETTLLRFIQLSKY